LDWLFLSDFDLVTTVAIWSIVGVTATALLLFVYTLGLRTATVLNARGRARFIREWRAIFAAAMLSRDDAQNITLPRVRRADRSDLLEEWNSTRSFVEGKAADNLVILARRAGVHDLASRLARKRGIRSRILAAQTLGNLGDGQRYDEMRELTQHPNAALSVTAAHALVQIDTDRGINVIVPMIEKRRDWPRNRVSIILRTAGSERISEPMYRVIRSAGSSGKAYLLQFAQLVESEVLDALIDELLRDSNDAAVLNAALKLVRGYRGVPRIAALTQHDQWFVRLQTAKVLGRIGQEEQLSLLESLLDDREWWVRYRAAQAIVSLPFLGPNQLRQMAEQQTDRYAADILRQAIAEVGLA
jgi:HEAT repeat protein